MRFLAVLGVCHAPDPTVGLSSGDAVTPMNGG
jgi:hypothetical protein